MAWPNHQDWTDDWFIASARGFAGLRPWVNPDLDPLLPSIELTQGTSFNYQENANPSENYLQGDEKGRNSVKWTSRRIRTQKKDRAFFMDTRYAVTTNDYMKAKLLLNMSTATKRFCVAIDLCAENNEV